MSKLKIFGVWSLYVFSFYLFLCLNLGIFLYDLKNAPLMLLFLIICVAIYYVFGRNRKSEIDNRKFLFLLVSIFTAFYIIEIVIMKYFHISGLSDAITCEDQAIHMIHNWEIKPELSNYFHMYPNNLNLIIVEGLLCRLFGNFNSVAYLFIFIVNLSSLFSCLIVKNLTKNNYVSLGIFFILQCFGLLTTRTYIPYTSNLAILFPILVVYIYTSKFTTRTKIICITFAASIGYLAKVTTLIPSLALAIVEILRIFYGRSLFDRKMCFITVISFFLCFGLSFLIKDCLWKSIGYQEDGSKVRDFSYFLFLGQNPNTGGQWDSIYVSLGNYNGTKNERDAYFYSVALKNIKQRRLVNNVKYYTSKTVMSWGSIKMDSLKLQTAFDGLFYIIRLSIWYIVLSLATLMIFFSRNRNSYMMIISLIGVTMYLWLSECAFTYVIMFSPIVFAMAGISMAGIIEKIRYNDMHEKSIQ